MQQKISTIQDVLDNKQLLKEDVFCYYDGDWFLDTNREILLDDHLCNALVNCEFLKLQDVVVSHHSYLLYKLQTIFLQQELLEQYKEKYCELLKCLLQKRTFTSIKQIKEYLEEHNFKGITTEKRNNAGYWSNNKYDNALVIKDNNGMVYTSNAYYGFSQNLKKKNMMLRDILRTVNNLFLGYNYPKVKCLSTSKYYTQLPSGGFRKDEKLWEQDYKTFEDQIVDKLQIDIA